MIRLVRRLVWGCAVVGVAAGVVGCGSSDGSEGTEDLAQQAEARLNELAQSPVQFCNVLSPEQLEDSYGGGPTDRALERCRRSQEAKNPGTIEVVESRTLSDDRVELTVRVISSDASKSPPGTARFTMRLNDGEWTIERIS